MSFFFLFFLHSICHSFAPFHSTPFHSHHSSKRPPCHCASCPSSNINHSTPSLLQTPSLSLNISTRILPSCPHSLLTYQ
ncbi:MAG: hypothetical protein J3R72DRAFT_435693 [Linnemannia gamsii]|nr:MAG: hypothetical protein J3R72DRAFT_435693 [Linnemannia gamsii]